MRGNLHYSETDKRYHLISDSSNLSLHCGDCIRVFIDGTELKGSMQMTDNNWHIFLNGADLINFEGIKAEEI